MISLLPQSKIAFCHGVVVTDRTLVQPVVNIEGEHVALGPIRRELVRFSTRWRNEFITAHSLDYDPAPVTLGARSLKQEIQLQIEENDRIEGRKAAPGKASRTNPLTKSRSSVCPRFRKK